MPASPLRTDRPTVRTAVDRREFLKHAIAANAERLRGRPRVGKNSVPTVNLIVAATVTNSEPSAWRRLPAIACDSIPPAPGEVTTVGPILRAEIGRSHSTGEHACYESMGYTEARSIRQDLWQSR
jgi:hypothetical protein